MKGLGGNGKSVCDAKWSRDHKKHNKNKFSTMMVCHLADALTDAQMSLDRCAYVLNIVTADGSAFKVTVHGSDQ